jgi:DNA-binding SARP family transcriptional activator
MGKVTYAIGFKNELPFQNEIKQQKRLYAQYQRTGNELLVAETATQIADTLLDQWEELIATGEAAEEEQKSLETALKYCDEARYIFKRFEKLKNVVRYRFI